MKLKDKIKSYSFWVSLASAVILILKVLGSRFGFSIDESMVSDIFTAICSVLVLLGIIVIPQAPQSTLENQNLQDTQKIASANNLNSDTTETTNKEPIKYLNHVTVDEVCEQDLTSVNLETQETDENLNTILETQTASIENVQVDNKITQTNINQTLSDEVNLDETLTPATLNELEQVNSSEELQLENKTNLTNENLARENLAEQTTENFSTANLKEMLSMEREKFSGDIDKYIFELQEEIRRIRENL